MSRTDRPVDLEQIRECSPGVSFWFPCQKGCCAREHYRIDRSSTDDGSCSAESESSYWALPVGPILSPQVSGKISQFLPSIHEGRFTLIDVKETQMSCELPNVSGVGAVAGTVLIPKCEDIGERHRREVYSNDFGIQSDHVSSRWHSWPLKQRQQVGDSIA